MSAICRLAQNSGAVVSTCYQKCLNLDLTVLALTAEAVRLS